MIIEAIRSRRIWDSRGNPTVEVDVTLEGGHVGHGIAPAGASRGTREAMDLRDGGPALRGMGVGRALASVDDVVAPALIGRDASDQAAVDAVLLSLDPSPLKDSLGGNATVAVSMAVLHAVATAAGKPLWLHISDTYGAAPSIPLPEVQIFGGGAHAGRRVDIQDFMIMVPGAGSFDEVLEITNEVYFAAGDIMKRKGKLAGVADEGGWWPAFDNNEEALETLTNAINAAGETPGKNVVISLDVAASEFCVDGRYRLALEDRELDTGEMIDLLGRWIDAYPIVSIEDPLSEADPSGMAEFTRRFGKKLQIIGDDYLVTNASLVREAASQGACNAVLIKVNQAGTISEAIDTFRAATETGYRCVVSARSGETEDVTISHLAAGLGTGQLKVGSFTRSERMAKWNECLRIQDELGAKAFVGGSPLSATWWGDQNMGEKS
ncbi:Enolase [Flavimaricola marinus]|uniref:Enolase n=2 Tax=Flavimaricola marinus TaxID=1819565 RepID=A0A238LLB7_9RHOB|nr:Enolase [Flavimaricola marinus]